MVKMLFVGSVSKQESLQRSETSHLAFYLSSLLFTLFILRASFHITLQDKNFKSQHMNERTYAYFLLSLLLRHLYK